MVTGFVQSLLPLITLVSSLSFSYTPSATLQLFNSQTTLQEIHYTVHIGDTLTSIANTVYGDESYWIVLWNDNRWIEDPDHIEPFWKLKIRQSTSGEIETLKSELLKKFNPGTFISQNELKVVEITSQKNLESTGPLTEEQLLFLGNCESGMKPDANTGNGYFGAFQFSYATWKSMQTGYDRADLAPIEVQKEAVQRLLTRSSIWIQFPGCAAKMRSAGLI